MRLKIRKSKPFNIFSQNAKKSIGLRSRNLYRSNFFSKLYDFLINWLIQIVLDKPDRMTDFFTKL